jgi:hypothetical protein
MPNSIKYSTSAQTLALKKGNFYIGTGDVGKGPTSTTDYYNGITPPAGGYTIYLNKASGGPSIYTAANDSSLISLSNTIAGQTFATAAAALAWFATQTDKMVFNIDYPAIVTNGLALNFDAGFTPSYPTTGTTWYDISGSGINGTLTNGPTFSSTNSGSIVFDGVDDFIALPNNVTGNWGGLTVIATVNMLSAQSSGYPAYFGTWTTNIGGNQFLGIENAKVYHHFEIDTTSSNTEFTGTIPIPYNQWYQVSMTWDGSTLREYVNAVSGRSASVSGTLKSNSFASIGKYYSGGPVPNGKIGGLQIYNRGLSQAEITQNYNSIKARYGL